MSFLHRRGRLNLRHRGRLNRHRCYDSPTSWSRCYDSLTSWSRCYDNPTNSSRCYDSLTSWSRCYDNPMSCFEILTSLCYVIPKSPKRYVSRSCMKSCYASTKLMSCEWRWHCLPTSCE